ncbi:TIGR03915 family putative DNA repair protein [Niabella yanshanensis]|uniref:TIGR03915 family putative DNA repair protein n=1 Tax=Niabella yanshanensis TaxID=577386 RepID=A0ABZ0W5U9_9BACT|nr:TIGR03915 family putative DNA repair protein [Niabella yanshanensis]WQD38059.1 TIGR03915 family putative DNA repair protein [Niabella yanshanensis]
MDYLFDGSFKGMLTAVFDCFERKDFNARLYPSASHQNSVFGIIHHVNTNDAGAQRVWKGLMSRLPAIDVRKIYVAYLSEIPEVYDKLFRLMVDVFRNSGDVMKNYGDGDILFITQVAKKVEREKHRMKAFIRFQKSKDQLYFATMEPDFNVLPLITRFFKERYADQQWLIYDNKRRYGAYYDTKTLSEIELNVLDITTDAMATDAVTLDEQEALYAALWKDYFKSTNIASRKNTRLHVRHVPKRYWRYLTEKQV